MQSQPFSIERLVVLLTPIFAGAASWFCAFLANNVPNAPKLDSTTVAVVMATTFAAVCAVIWKWLHGRQIPEIAGLAPTVSQIGSQVSLYLSQHAAELQGPPGPAGESTSPDQILAFIHDELQKLKPDLVTDVRAGLPEVGQLLEMLQRLGAPPAAAPAQ